MFECGVGVMNVGVMNGERGDDGLDEKSVKEND